MDQFDSVSSAMNGPRQPSKVGAIVSGWFSRLMPGSEGGPAKSRVGLVIGLVAAAVVVIAAVTIVTGINRAADEKTQQQQDHDRSVSYYSGNYQECGKAFCP